MITEKDIQILKSYDTPLGKIVTIGVTLVPLFLLALCLINLFMASSVGNAAGYDLSSLFRFWFSGVDVKHQYYGIFISALARLHAAVLQFSLAITVAMMAVMYHKRRKMDQRILETLKSKNVA